MNLFSISFAENVCKSHPRGVKNVLQIHLIAFHSEVEKLVYFKYNFPFFPPQRSVGFRVNESWVWALSIKMTTAFCCFVLEIVYVWTMLVCFPMESKYRIRLHGWNFQIKSQVPSDDRRFTSKKREQEKANPIIIILCVYVYVCVCLWKHFHSIFRIFFCVLSLLIIIKTYKNHNLIVDAAARHYFS